MANITQQIPNFLGGVSTQPDDQKLPNQVSEIINGYPDPTFGLIKRPGFNWIANLVLLLLTLQVIGSTIAIQVLKHM
jgi:hypothetical protein